MVEAPPDDESAYLATCGFLLRLLSHHDKQLKKAGRLILSNTWFYFAPLTNNWDIRGVLHNGTRDLLADLGIPLQKLYEREKLQERLGSYKPPMIIDHTRRQDYALPRPPGCDWKRREQEEAYIHFLRLIAYAIDESYQRAVAECVEPFSCDKKPFKHAGIKKIKGFTRMFNKLISPVDHRYAGKPRPGLFVCDPGY